MAITQTGAMYKSLTFDGKTSREYGVYITGEAVYNAPARDVEMITIPGRSGTFALDNGRFENIEVTYPAGIFADTEADFRQAISDFRNFLCSRKGYVRLSDEYNPGEYRMAVYKSGLDVDPAMLRAGEFKITFECKPQRWLVSGETAVTVTSGDTLTNPTLFEASPLLEATGNGSIEFNGYDIEFAGVPYGEIVIGESKTEKLPIQTGTPTTIYQDVDTSLLNIGDRVYPETKECVIIVRLSLRTGDFRDMSIGSTTNVLEAKTATVPGEGVIEQYLDLYLYPDFGDGFVYDTIEQIICTAEFNYKIRGQSTVWTETVQVTLDYTVTNYRIEVYCTGTIPYNVDLNRCWITAPTMYGNSSKLVSVPIFIDCDLGEAYIVENGVYRSLNKFIDLGSELPKLGVGETEVTFDNTITELKVTPRWWKV